MPRRTAQARAIRLWPYVLGVLFIAYAITIPEPHAFNNAAIDRATWAIGGALLLWAAVHPTRRWRLIAMLAAVALCAIRITVLAAYPSTLTAGRITAGAVVWSMLGILIVCITLASELIDSPARLNEH